MIDWASLGANALWIVGLALALATFSYGSWQAVVQGEQLRKRLRQPGIQIAFSLAGLLFSAGLAATAGAPLEMVLWGGLTLLFLLQIVLTIRRRSPIH